MSEGWIKELAQKERERRKTLELFEKAAPQFLKKLVSALLELNDLYVKEFPGEHSGTQIASEKSYIEIVSKEYQVPNLPKACLLLSGISSEISCSFENIKHHTPAWSQALEVDEEGELHLMGVGQSHTINVLSAKILIPVLFPNLTRDPVARRYLND